MDFFADIVNKALELRKESGESKVKLQKTFCKKSGIYLCWWVVGSWFT